ncbi:hypothetical protein [Cohnella silvisoli]|uniref:Uncharacterized protein n=1 Tax=Cohnella silvisoli TaxID=2873699 RepID=A0ABV1KZ32_9BACL|nr:hypothetical protein [Cohnella silvisoli]MCD9024302.1 hypothetical protein [Cohnella silvisoli]
MRAIYIYNPHSAPEVALISRVQTELGGYVEIVPIDEAPDLVRRLVRETPAFISADEHLQGQALLDEGVDGKLLLTAILYQRMEADELAIHQAETHRLDNLINVEKATAIDEYTLELIDGGVI